MKNISKLFLTLALLASASAGIQAYNDAANEQLKELLGSRNLPTAVTGQKWSFEDGQTIKSLIEQGANPDLQLGEGMATTPIFAAIYSNNPDAVEAVVKAGANLTEVEKYYENTPLQYSTSTSLDNYRPRNPRIIQILESASKKIKL